MIKSVNFKRSLVTSAIAGCMLTLLSQCQQVSPQAHKALGPLQSNTLLSKPVGLRTELMLGTQVFDIKDAKPEFSWVIEDTGLQSAYQIQVYQLAQTGTESLVWDSGKVESASSLAHEYSGEALLSSENYRWQVKVWSHTGNGISQQSAWSDPQIFTTAKVFDNSVSTYQQTTSLVSPQSITQLPSGKYLIDFGKVVFGYLALELRSNKDGVIDVTLAERGDKNGAIPKQDPRSSVRYYTVPIEVNEKFDTYRVNPPRDKRNTKSDKAIPIPGRFGRITPFRFVEIDPKGLELSDIDAKQVFIHYPFDELSSSFSSSNQVLNDIWDLSKYSMKATSFAGVYVDGDRERIPYEADAYINQLSHYAVDNQYTLARNTHEYLLAHPTWPTEWKQHSVMMAWTDWMYTGDIESLKHQYSVLKEQKLLRFLANEQGLLVSHPNGTHQTSMDIVDWPPVERDGYEFKDINTVVNAFHYLNLTQMADIAKVLGYSDDAAEFTEYAARLYQSFNQTLFDPDTGLYIDGVGSRHSSAHANILPLAVGLVPENRVPKVVKYVKSKGMAVSVYFAQYLLEALYRHGHQEHAFKLLTSKDLRSWYNMLRVGSTITLEAWDDQFKPNQDWNHAWGAVPGNITARYILGVQPLTAGFEQVAIAPHFAGLEYAQGKVPTIRGPINIQWRTRTSANQNTTLVRLTIELPGNTQAQLRLPKDEGQFIKGVKINDAWVEVEEDGQLVHPTLAPGKYQVDIEYQ